MSESEIEIGPVDYLILEWPAGTQPTGEGLAHRRPDQAGADSRARSRVRAEERGRHHRRARDHGPRSRRQPRPGAVRRSLVGDHGAGRLRRGRRCPRGGRRCGDSGFREHVGRPVRQRSPGGRGAGCRERADPRRRSTRGPRRRRSLDCQQNSKGANDDATSPRNRPDSRDRRYRDRRVEPRLASTGCALGEQDAQQQQYAQVPPPAAAPAATSQSDRLEQLKTLGELKAAGVLTDAEFEVQKEKILQS